MAAGHVAVAVPRLGLSQEIKHRLQQPVRRCRHASRGGANHRHPLPPRGIDHVHPRQHARLFARLRNNKHFKNLYTTITLLPDFVGSLPVHLRSLSANATSYRARLTQLVVDLSAVATSKTGRSLKLEKIVVVLVNVELQRAPEVCELVEVAKSAGLVIVLVESRCEGWFPEKRTICRTSVILSPCVLFESRPSLTSGGVR